MIGIYWVIAESRYLQAKELVLETKLYNLGIVTKLPI